jgi:hypothetical protein
VLLRTTNTTTHTVVVHWHNDFFATVGRFKIHQADLAAMGVLPPTGQSAQEPLEVVGIPV